MDTEKYLKELERKYSEYEYFHVEIYSDGSGCIMGWGLGVDKKEFASFSGLDDMNKKFEMLLEREQMKKSTQEYLVSFLIMVVVIPVTFYSIFWFIKWLLGA